MDAETEAVALDPETARILQETAALELVDRSTLPVAEARRQMEAGSAVWNADPPDMAAARDFAIDGPLGPIPLRLLRPKATETNGAIVYFHGGGFVLGSLESHHRLMRMLAIESRSAVIGVDYRLAPEHPFPGPLDDCLAAGRWLRRNARTLDLDPDRVVLAGDSAGANLALACLLTLRDAAEPPPLGAALFYGCYWARLGTESHRKFGGGGYRLSTREMGWFWSQYLGDRGRGDPLAEPMNADFAGLPPLFLNYGEVDPLADDTRELVGRLDRAGVVHECVAYPGLVHGFLQMTARVKPAAAAMADAGRAIRDMLR
jgi:acetyl esterase